MKRIVFVIVIGVLMTFGCQQKQERAAEASTPDPHAGSDASAVGAIQAMSDAGTLDSSDIRYDLPPNWTREVPTSSMRLDQAVIPGPAGDGQLAVFFFGVGGGGGVTANLDRWAGQVQHETDPVRTTFDVDGYNVSMIEVEGILLPSGMSGGPTEPQPDFVLYGAVVEGTGGPWFFKATGAKETMALQREAFVGMLKSVRANL